MENKKLDNAPIKIEVKTINLKMKNLKLFEDLLKEFKMCNQRLNEIIRIMKEVNISNNNEEL